MMRHSVTVFTVTNIADTTAYYRDRLGFQVAFEYGTPATYVGLTEGNVSLHLIALVAEQSARRPRRRQHLR